MDTMTYALNYAADGIPVFPLCGKRPYVKGGFKAATTDEQTIRRWWARWPDANIGIPTGHASGLIVIDIDTRSGGMDSAESIDVPQTQIVKTPSGGEHWIFAMPDYYIRSRVNFLPGVDIRADGGYIVAAPSTDARGSWAVSNELGPVELPDHFAQALDGTPLDRPSYSDCEFRSWL